MNTRVGEKIRTTIKTWSLSLEEHDATTCGEGGRGGASRLLSVSPPCFRDRGGTVVSPALLHAPPPLRLPLPVDENLGGAELLQELLLHVLRLNPGFLLLPARHRAANKTDRLRLT